jgi:hypothetical protein
MDTNTTQTSIQKLFMILASLQQVNTQNRPTQIKKSQTRKKTNLRRQLQPDGVSVTPH